MHRTLLLRHDQMDHPWSPADTPPGSSAASEDRSSGNSDLSSVPSSTVGSLVAPQPLTQTAAIAQGSLDFLPPSPFALPSPSGSGTSLRTNKAGLMSQRSAPGLRYGMRNGTTAEGEAAAGSAEGQDGSDATVNLPSWLAPPQTAVAIDPPSAGIAPSHSTPLPGTQAGDTLVSPWIANPFAQAAAAAQQQRQRASHDTGSGAAHGEVAHGAATHEASSAEPGTVPINPLLLTASGFHDEDEDGEDGSNDGEGHGLHGHGSYASPSVRTSATATAEEISQLKDELLTQRSVAAGLRGELRKFSQLTAALEAEVQTLRTASSGSGSGSAPGHAAPGSTWPGTSTGRRSFSSDSHSPTSAAVAAAGHASHLTTVAVNIHAAKAAPLGSPSPDVQEGPHGPSRLSQVSPAGAPPPLSPVSPPGQGLEADKRLQLYHEALSGSLTVAVGPMLEELQAAQEVLKGKDHLDSGSEKVLLIKLQRILATGASATRYLDMIRKDTAAAAAVGTPVGSRAAGASFTSTGGAGHGGEGAHNGPQVPLSPDASAAQDSAAGAHVNGMADAAPPLALVAAQPGGPEGSAGDAARASATHGGPSLEPSPPGGNAALSAPNSEEPVAPQAPQPPRPSLMSPFAAPSALKSLAKAAGHGPVLGLPHRPGPSLGAQARPHANPKLPSPSPPVTPAQAVQAPEAVDAPWGLGASAGAGTGYEAGGGAPDPRQLMDELTATRAQLAATTKHVTALQAQLDALRASNPTAAAAVLAEGPSSPAPPLSPVPHTADWPRAGSTGAGSGAGEGLGGGESAHVRGDVDGDAQPAVLEAARARLAAVMQLITVADKRAAQSAAHIGVSVGSLSPLSPRNAVPTGSPGEGAGSTPPRSPGHAPLQTAAAAHSPARTALAEAGTGEGAHGQTAGWGAHEENFSAMSLDQLARRLERRVRASLLRSYELDPAAPSPGPLAGLLDTSAAAGGGVGPGAGGKLGGAHVTASWDGLGVRAPASTTIITTTTTTTTTTVLGRASAPEKAALLPHADTPRPGAALGAARATAHPPLEGSSHHPHQQHPPGGSPGKTDVPDAPPSLQLPVAFKDVYRSHKPQWTPPVSVTSPPRPAPTAAGSPRAQAPALSAGLSPAADHTSGLAGNRGHAT